MNNIKKRWKPDVSRAWQTFYARVDSEGLLYDEGITNCLTEPEAPSLDRVRKRRVPSFYVKWSVAAVISALCVGIATFYWMQPSYPKMITIQNNQDHEVLVATLPDGSMVFLSGGSELTYRRSSHLRQVTLKGEAFFDVFKDQKCVFLVETELITVSVLGTSFRIKCDQESPFELTVKSGMVQVALKDEEQMVFAEAGEQVEWVDNWLHKSYLEDVNVLSEHVRKLYFKDESLGQIVRVLNECTLGSKRLTLDDDFLSDRKITVALEVEKGVEGFADIICVAFDLNQTVEEDLIHISKK